MSADSQRRAPPGGGEQDRDQQHVRGGERAEERRDEPAQRPLVAEVVDPVLRQAREALAVVEPELLAEPARHAGVAPGLQRDGVDVDEPPGRDDTRDAEDRPTEAAPVGMAERDPAAEEVGGNGDQIVAEAEEHAARGRLAAEPVLRDHGVEEDERRVDEREPIGRRRLERDPAPPPDDRAEREREQHLLPGGDDVEREVADAEIPEPGHREVVERAARRRTRGAPTLGFGQSTIATSVRPRLTIRASGGKRPRSAPGPSRQFCFAHGLRARSYARCESRVGKPVDERQERVHLDRKPAVRRRDERPAGDAERLLDEAALLLAAADVLDHRVREDDVELAVRERQLECVALDVADARVSLPETRSFVQADAP